MAIFAPSALFSQAAAPSTRRRKPPISRPMIVLMFFYEVLLFINCSTIPRKNTTMRMLLAQELLFNILSKCGLIVEVIVLEKEYNCSKCNFNTKK